MSNHLPCVEAGRFRGAQNIWQEAAFVLLGVPLDLTTTFRPGTRFGPREIRNMSHSLELYSPFQDRSLEEISYADAGDLHLPVGNLEESLKIIEESSRTLFEAGKFPCFLGGEHLLTWATMKACLEFYPDLVLLDWDAHADMRDHWQGSRHNHGTVMNTIRESIGGDRMHLMGIRSEGQRAMDNARKTHLHLQHVLQPMQSIKDKIGDRPVYFTLDIDVMDPAYAPGTGAPEPGGITSGEALEALNYIKDLNVVAMDLVEVAPAYDPAQMTPLLAARILREFLLLKG